MSTKNTENNLFFLHGGGEMGQLTRMLDWSRTPVGDMQGWPQSLKTTLSILLNSRFPMFLWWGPELVCFYNDAYRPSLGQDGKHPSILGMPAQQAWPEIWETIKPLIDQVLAGGEATWSENQLIPIFRNGKLEDVYWTFSYSPVQGESGKVEGVLVTCSETTDAVNHLSQLEESKDQLSFAIEATELGTFDYEPSTDRFKANARLKEWFGLPPHATIELGDALNAVADHDRQRVTEAIQRALDYSSGGSYDIEYTIVHPESRKEIIVKARGRAWFDDTKTAYRFNGTLQDVTEQALAHKRIEESEKRFRTLAEQAPLGITIFRGADFVVEMANERYLQIVDRTESSFIGRPLFDSLPEVQEAVEPFLTQVLTTGVPYMGTEFPVFLNRYDKKELTYFNFVYHPLKEDDGTITRVIVIATEVTSMVNARHTLEESERQFRNLVMQSPMAITIFRGRDFVIELANSRMMNDLWRLNEDEVLGRKLLDVFPELRGQKYPELLNEVFDSGKIHTETESLAYVQGGDKLRKFYLDFEYAPLYDVDNKVSGIIATVNDVTERVEARRKLEESEASFRLLADSMPQFVWSSDPKGNLNYFNQSVYQFSGLQPDLIRQRGWMQIVHPDDKEANLRAWLYSIKTGEEFCIEHRLRRSDGNYRWLLSRAIPLKDSEGTIQMWVGTSTDIHDQKAFTSELEKLVQERTEELKQKNTDLEKINKELQSFTYISSHDLQEPLRKIQTFASRILEKEYPNLSETGKEYFKRMSVSASRMQLLINDLLAYSRTTTSERKFQETPLTEILEAVKMDMKEEIQQKNALIEAESLGSLKMIPFQFHQLFYNLISNSLKFSRPGVRPHLTITSGLAKGPCTKNELAADTSYHHIRFTDNGIGFDQKYGERIFQLFQRLNGKNEYSGTGIGLAIVKKIVENHHGSIVATGQINAGATFDIFIPQA
ncbi:PAS domain-containing protein [Salmonirosea aquatica]|uniref:histidine kinase n=1 Tax=Salmonirosea aquatica TaxID=2654236 RepID=A0A7C9BCL6_9BACT|nr:PAS domain-containing protein [Cytophagaceae bacterium SJW1-29]